MKMMPVRSSLISAVGHEERTGLLKVQFHQGGSYMYGNVPVEKYHEMLKADSMGKFFHQHIKKNKGHSVVKMEDQD